jgi:hypothetical protein
MIMHRPLYDFKAAGGSDPREQCLEQEEKTQFGKPASAQPDHKWVIMSDGYTQVADGLRESSYRIPDNFNMYIYNDWEGYGLHEMVENFVSLFAPCPKLLADIFKLVRFHKEYSKTAEKRSLQELWCTISALVHWISLKGNEFFPFNHVDDSDRVEGAWDLIGRAFLAMLNLLDRAGQLKADSDFKDLALVMALTLSFTVHCRDLEVGWAVQVIKYAQDNGLDLANSEFAGAKHFIAKNQLDLRANKIKFPQRSTDRWQFKRAFTEHVQDYGTRSFFDPTRRRAAKLGGTAFDITKFSSEDRKRLAFDHEDPLAGFSEKELEAGMVAFTNGHY